MAVKVYTEQEIERADRLLGMIDKVPKEKQDDTVRMAEAFLAGAASASAAAEDIALDKSD